MKARQRRTAARWHRILDRQPVLRKEEPPDKAPGAKTQNKTVEQGPEQDQTGKPKNMNETRERASEGVIKAERN